MFSKRTEFLPFALPDIGDNEFQQVKEAMLSGWVTSGPKTRLFEKRFADAVGATYAVAVNSCTAAMHLALEAIGLEADDEVITTPYTFAASAEVIRYFNAHPILVDVCPDDFNINPKLIEAAITPKTKAIIPVHIAGASAQLDIIYEIAERYNLAVIEDAAHAFPTTYNGKMIGSNVTNSPVKRVVCFSFYATKTITTGEGGMLCTDDPDIAERCRIMSLHGISKDAWKRYTAEGSWYYEIIAPGFKYNMTDVAAAMGLAQLDKATSMWQRRREISQRFNEAFSSIPELQIPFCGKCQDDSCCQSQACVHAWHLYMLRLNTEFLTIDRSEFVDDLKESNIGVSVHFIPLHTHPYYQDKYGYQPNDYPVAYQEYSREISLPIYSKMSDSDVEDVISAVIQIVMQHSTRSDTLITGE